MKPMHLLNGIETFGKEFPQKIPQLISELSNVLDIDVKLLDKKTESLKLLDISLYHKMDMIDEEFVEANIMRIEAYLGEVFIENFGGMWETEYEEKFNIHVPCINFNGKRISFYPSILENLLYEDAYPDIKWLFWFCIPRELR